MRWEILDEALRQAHAHHQALAIRLMPYDQKHPLPEWYQNSGARRANQPTDKDGKIWQPDFSDPLYLKYWGEVVAAAGARYDGHPDLDSVDISSVGYWGEGWSPYMPAFEVQKKADRHLARGLQAHAAADELRPGEGAGLRHRSTARAGGWTAGATCAAPRRADWCHMFDLYPEQIVRAGHSGRVAAQPGVAGNLLGAGRLEEEGYDLDYILAQALRWHVTSVNIKSSAIPPEWKAAFDDFQKKMGYRFILRRLEYPQAARGRHDAADSHVVAERRRGACLSSVRSGAGVALGAAAARPSSCRWTCANGCPAMRCTMARSIFPTPEAGDYRVRVALLDPRTGQPAIKLAIEGRQPDGWYDVGAISIE